ncbi:MAG TPA: hypothetical protein VKA31_10250 [Mariprofundaceae bacterium]|nr:hypothetical protein [Mariprofundaceae bacterium]
MSEFKIARRERIGVTLVRRYLRDAGLLERSLDAEMRAARNEQIVDLRKKGESFRSIGKKFGIGPDAVRSVIIKADLNAFSECAYGLTGLSVRAKNGILNALPQDVYRAVKDGTRVVGIDDVRGCMPIGATNIGKKTLEEIELWLASKEEEVTPPS